MHVPGLGENVLAVGVFTYILKRVLVNQKLISTGIIILEYASEENIFYRDST